MTSYDTISELLALTNEIMQAEGLPREQALHDARTQLADLHAYAEDWDQDATAEWHMHQLETLRRETARIFSR